ncbi:hypothetical protein [Acinetobacter higginsii]|uniref:hypothetical protein n=1 Tax=Acinetobacter higginsii TaxID=70347 RepID=UPI001F4AECA7|nr:hypothetical protein [Acinetobacter higginsii]MCH7380364.1 hypothetical protein [Acinetobacter higginsii]
MNAIQFIKDHGVEVAREGIEEANAYGGFWVNAKTLELSKQIPSYDAVSIPDIQRLVESLDLVELLGGIKSLKGLVDISNSPFALSHITREGVIYSMDEIKKAIADYESIYGGEHV